MRIFCFLLLMTIFSGLNAQNKYNKDFYLININPDFVFDSGEKRQVDSILKLYHASKTDSVQLFYLRFFSEGLTNEFLWTSYNHLLYERSKNKDDSLHKYYKACALNNLGYEAQFIKNDLETARKKYQESYVIFKEINNAAGIGAEINNLAYIYQHEGNTQKCIELYMEAGKLFEKANEPLGLTSIYINMGDIYFQNDEIEKAEDFFNKALFYSLKTGQQSVVANAYNQLGALYLKKGIETKAVSYYEKALSIYKNDRNYGRQALICIGLCNVYYNIKDMEMYEKYILESYSNALLSSDLQIKAKVYQRLSMFHISKGDYAKAFLFSDSSYRFAKQLAYSELVAESAKTLSDIYKHNENFSLAYKFLNEAKNIEDSLKTDASRKSIIKSQYQLEYNKKDIELKAEQDKKDAIRRSEKRQQQFILGLTLVALAIIMAFAFIAFKNYRKTRKQNIIIESQKQEVVARNSEITHQKTLLEEKQKEIFDSINYAKHLQEAILPPKTFIESHLPSSFILYQPKDVVAGDFYWAEKKGDLFFIAAADSTGHGVPGAMVSVVCSNALNRSVKEFGLSETGKILDKTRELVIETFEKSSSDVKDGMDISLLCVNLKNKTLSWSGANNPLWYILDNKLEELKADKQPIGKTDNAKSFTTHIIPYKAGMIIYLFTDGMADQFGGPNGKKFKYKQFSDQLLLNSKLSMTDQALSLEKTFTSWKGNLEQVDDVCVIGIKLN